MIRWYMARLDFGVDFSLFLLFLLLAAKHMNARLHSVHTHTQDKILPLERNTMKRKWICIFSHWQNICSPFSRFTRNYPKRQMPQKNYISSKFFAWLWFWKVIAIISHSISFKRTNERITIEWIETVSCFLMISPSIRWL